MPSTRLISDAVVRLQKAWAQLEKEWSLRYPDAPVPFLTEVFRPASVQRAYYAQGREKVSIVNGLRRGAGLPAISEVENRRVITKAKPGQSKHERWPSQAFDIAFKVGDRMDWNPELFHQAAEIIREQFPDVRWGGDWNGNWKADESFIDRPHFEV